LTLNFDVAEWLTNWCHSDVGRRAFEELPTGRAAPDGVIRLRKSGLSLEQASAVVELRELRQRAVGKFEHASELYFTRRAYEQASGQKTTRWKVATLQQHWPSKPLVVLDLCCGIGGDLLEFGRHFPTIGLDRDPALVHLTRENLKVLGAFAERHPSLVICADVSSILPGNRSSSEGRPPKIENVPGNSGKTLAEWLPFLPPTVSEWARTNHLLEHTVVWHLDPDRRDTRGRHTNMTDLSPDEGFLADLLSWSGTGIVKLAPATELSDPWKAAGHWQWLGLDRECKQLLGWFGLEPSLPIGHTSVAVAQRHEFDWTFWQPLSGATTSVARSRHPLTYLFEPHPAIFAARLNHQFAAERGWLAWSGGDYYTAMEPAEPTDEMFGMFRVLDVLPFRIEKIRDWLARHQRPLVEIKSRTVAEKDWSPLARLLGGPGGQVDAAGGSGLMFSEQTAQGQALRVALCERIVKR